MSKASTALIIPAAGKSVRFGGSSPKQFSSTAGDMLLVKTLNAFKRVDIHSCIIALPQSYMNIIPEQIGTDFPFPIHYVEGGDTRAESVQNAVYACDASITQLLIHDAARPHVSQELIQRILDGLKTHDAVIPGVAIPDTLKYVSKNVVQQTLNRDEIKAIQTPRGFDLKTIQAPAW